MKAKKQQKSAAVSKKKTSPNAGAVKTIKLPYKETKARGVMIYCAKITFRKSDDPKEGRLRETLVFGADPGEWDRGAAMKKCRAIITTMDLLKPKFKLKAIGPALA